MPSTEFVKDEQKIGTSTKMPTRRPAIHTAYKLRGDPRFSISVLQDK